MWDKLKKITVQELENDIQFVTDDELEQQVQKLKTIQYRRKVKTKRDQIYATLKSLHESADTITVHMNHKTAQAMFIDVIKDGATFRFSKKMCNIKCLFYLDCNGEVLWVGEKDTSLYPAQTVKYDWINVDMTRAMFKALIG